jgi:hypothetical protein
VRRHAPKKCFLWVLGEFLFRKKGICHKIFHFHKIDVGFGLALLWATGVSKEVLGSNPLVL